MESHTRHQVASWTSHRMSARSLVRRTVLLLIASPVCGGLPLTACPASAAPGQADLSFGTNGVVETDVEQLLGYPGSGVSTAGLARQSDGKLVAALNVLLDEATATFGCAVIRYTSSGALDTTFGSGGGVLFTVDPCAPPQPIPSFGCGDVVVREDHKIVVSGVTRSLCSPQGFFGAFVRLNPDGSLDSSFGNAGRTILAFRSVVSRLALQPDGKILGAGAKIQLIAGDDVLVLRLNANGALDTGFGAGSGFVTNNFFADDGALAVALQPDGKIVAAGFTELGGTLNDWVVLRYDSSGSLDPFFGSTGYVVTHMGSCCSGGDLAKAVAIQSDGKILVGGRGLPVSRMARYLPDGQLDSSFGSGGKLNLPASGDVLDVDLQFNGKVVATAELSFVGRFLESGALDTSFGNSGQVNPAPPGFVKRTLIEPSGRIIVAFVTPLGGVGLAAYEGDPVPPSPTPAATATATRTPSGTPTPTEPSTPTPEGPATACPAEPRTGCDAPRRSKLVIRNALDDAQDGIELLLWRGRPRRASSAFGNPLASTDTLVCVYDGNGLLLELVVPPGPRWSPLGQRGFAYTDPAGNVAGIQRFSLERRAGWLVRHETTIRLQAQGTNVPEVSLPLTAPVTVQVLNDATDVCFGDTFAGERVRTNASLIFRGLRR